MGMGIYMISDDVNDIFDEIRNLNIDGADDIISDILDRSDNSDGYADKLDLTSDRINANALKRVFDDKYSYEQLEEFVKIFKNIQNQTSTTKNILNRSMVKNKQKNGINQSGQLTMTEDLLMALSDIDDDVAWFLFQIDSDSFHAQKGDSDFKNTLGIKKLDVSDLDYNFDVYYTNGKKGRIKIIDFIKAYDITNKFEKKDVTKFINAYNKVKSKKPSRQGTPIKVPDFSFNPKDIRSTFISLVTETYPYGHEEEVIPFLPNDLEMDEYGNYFKIIGKSDIMFTSHLDTASREKSEINLLSFIKDGDEMLSSDGTTILGADDKAGVTVMLYMMANNVPGVYYFFIGEERGGIGSGKIADVFYQTSILKGIKKVVSFDRRNYYSVITSQYGMECCSNEFADSLCKELNKSGLRLNLDPTGVFTDSANFIDYVPECTNVSVGYFSEHTHDEVQNITYLEKLAKACVSANWNALIIKRKVGFDSDYVEKYSELITYIKSSRYRNDVNIKGIDGKPYITIEFTNTKLSSAYEDLLMVETALMLFDYDPDITFDGDTIKIKLA